MDDLLKPISTTRIATSLDANANLKPINASTRREAIKVDTLDDALQVLQGEPNAEELTLTLAWIDNGKDESNGFNIKAPSSKASRLVFALLNDVIPNYWDILSKSSPSDGLTKALVRCLSSVAGIGAIASRIHVLLTELVDQSKLEKAGSIKSAKQLIELLELILRKESFASRVWNDLILVVPNGSKRHICWKELISLLAAGRILSLAAQVHHVNNETTSSIDTSSWLSVGSKYATWLSRNIAYMVQQDDPEVRKAATLLFRRSLVLGYSGIER